MSNHIRIGNQTALAADDPLTPYRFAIEHGFDAFEWFSDRRDERGFAIEMFDAAGRVQLAGQAATHDMRFSVHAPCDADPWRQSDDQALMQSVDFASDIGAEVVVLHANVDAPLHSFLESLTPAARRARDAGVRLALENTVDAPPDLFNALFTQALIPPEIEPAIGMCLDIGHANLCPATLHDYVGYLDQLDPRVPIVHMHMHENYGDRDSHLTLFTGPAGQDDAGIRALLERLEHRGYHGSLILEQWPDPPALLTAARERLRKILGHMSVHR